MVSSRGFRVKVAGAVLVAMAGAANVTTSAQQAGDKIATASSGLLQGPIGMPAAGSPSGQPTICAARVSVPLLIDGSLDDAAWRTATRVNQLVQLSPVEGSLATEQTEIFVAYDSQTIYFGFYVHYSDISLVRANRGDRDKAQRDDTIAVYFDTFLDQQRAYVFTVNGYGVPGDGIVNSRGVGAATGEIPSTDSSWDALFSAAGRPVEDGWTAEMAIPVKSLRYPTRSDDEDHRWGFQIVRSIEGKNETDVWAPVSRSVAGFLTQMGVLHGITNLSTTRNLELQPTFTAIRHGSLDATTRAFAGNNLLAEGGFNAKYGLTPNLTLDFTWNPDFSQIESDRAQIEVNQRFPLRYPELRPFFLEGQEIFRLNEPSSMNLVHTRTIIDPRYGAKITGKLGRTTIGVIVAEDEAPGRRDDPADPARGQTAQFFVGRGRQDIYADSYVGTFITHRSFMDGLSRVGGVDSNFRVGQTINVGGMAAVSKTREEDGIERSGHYRFVRFEHSGRNLNVYAFQKDGSAGFRTDTGFIQNVDQRQYNLDYRQTNARIRYRWWPAGRTLVSWGPNFSYLFDYDIDGTLRDRATSAGLNFSFANNATVELTTNRTMERFRGTEFWKSGYTIRADVRSSRWLSIDGNVSWGDEIRYIDAPYLGSGMGVGLNVILRPSSRLQSQLNIATKRLLDLDGQTEAFDIKIHRALTTYQLTSRLLVRKILEYNTFAKTLAANVTFTYRVNAGTALYVGWDDHFKQASLIDSVRFSGITDLRRTNRAIFAKIQYLFRYDGS